MLGLMLVLSLGTARPVPWRDLAVLVPLVHLGLQAARNTPLLVIVATPILGRAIASCAGAHWGSLPVVGRRVIAVGALGLVVSSCGLVAGSRQPARVWNTFRPQFGVAETLPTGAVEFLRREGRHGTLWNEYAWGGYLIWHLYPELRVSIDGRMAVYGPERFGEHLAVSELTPGWQDVLARLAPDAAIVRNGSPRGVGAPRRGLGGALRGQGRDGARSSGAERMIAGRAVRWTLWGATLLAVATIAVSSRHGLRFLVVSGLRPAHSRDALGADDGSLLLHGGGPALDQPHVGHAGAVHGALGALGPPRADRAEDRDRDRHLRGDPGDDARPRRPSAAGGRGDPAGGVGRRRVLACAASDVHVPLRGHPGLAPAPGLGGPAPDVRGRAGTGDPLGEPPRRFSDGGRADRDHGAGDGAAAPRRP